MRVLPIETVFGIRLVLALLVLFTPVSAVGQDDRESTDGDETKKKAIGSDAIHALGHLESTEQTPYLTLVEVDFTENAGLSKDDLEPLFPRSSPPDVAAKCFEKVHRPDPGGVAEVTFTLTIGKDGLVDRVDISSIETSKATADCIAQGLEMLQFPERDSSTRATMTFEYNPDVVGRGHTVEGVGVDGAGRGRTGVTEGSDESNERGDSGDNSEDKSDGKSDETSDKPEISAPSKPTVKGALAKEVIRRVMQKSSASYKYCYEKELQKDPDIEGTLLVKFTIGPTGKVVAAVARKDTLDNEAVTGCVLRITKRLEFPEPKGGGVVVVNYPFAFSSK